MQSFMYILFIIYLFLVCFKLHADQLTYFNLALLKISPFFFKYS